MILGQLLLLELVRKSIVLEIIGGTVRKQYLGQLVVKANGLPASLRSIKGHARPNPPPQSCMQQQNAGHVCWTSRACIAGLGKATSCANIIIVEPCPETVSIRCFFDDFRERAIAVKISNIQTPFV